ncbi:protein-tyrosine phosphatase family protein [Zavarzinella formosa]|uniref:hypothetical protein n=1 Tax=Zavarzinella formosa TaxID=360055 RepID=UPI0012F9082B|nr:hypothetical protein [Zavarzinella formosa]
MILLSLLLASCTKPVPIPEQTTAPLEPVMVGNRPGLHNVIRLNDHLLSGSSPEGEAGFRSLQDLGVKFIVSVDGAAPEVAMAAKFGMRYAHLPVGYDGIPADTALKLAKLFAMAEREGPVYVHCHHGTHRGPAAAVAGLRCRDGRCSAKQAVDFMKMAGTDPKYAGLYRDVEAMTANELAGVAGEFPPSVATVNNLVKQMVSVDERWDHVKLIRAAGWTTSKGHADLDPAHEVLQLREHFREAARLPETAKRPGEFQRLMSVGEELAGKLEDDLRGGKEKSDRETLFRLIGENCTACHREFRDRK